MALLPFFRRSSTSPPTPQALYLRGILLAAAGMTVISPDGMLLHSLQSAPLLDVLFWRSLGLAVTLGLVLAAVYRGRLWSIIVGQGWPGAAAAVLMAASNFFFVLAMLNTSVANTLIILATMPFWSAILGVLLIGEAVQRRTWIAIAVALGGIGVIFSESLGSGFGGDTLLGDLAALGAALCHGLNLVMLRRAGDRDMTAALAGSGVITVILCLPFLQPALVPARDLGILVLLGFLILPVALTLFLSGARYAPAAEVALLSLVETVLGPLLAWLVLSDAPTAHGLIGGGLVLAAVIGNAGAGLVARKRRRGRVVPP